MDYHSLVPTPNHEAVLRSWRQLIAEGRVPGMPKVFTTADFGDIGARHSNHSNDLTLPKIA